MIKDVKVYFKSLKGRMVLTVAGISTGAMVLSGCSGCSTEKIDSVDDPSEVILSEVPSEIEIIETSEPLEDEKNTIEMPMKDENGELYVPEITEEQLVAKIEEISNIAKSDYERDSMLSAMFTLNQDNIDHVLVYKYDYEYCKDLDEYGLQHIIMEWNYGKEELPLSFYFIDEKTAKKVDEFEKMMAEETYDLDVISEQYVEMKEINYGLIGRASDHVPMSTLYEYSFYLRDLLPMEGDKYYGLRKTASLAASSTLQCQYEKDQEFIDNYVSHHKGDSKVYEIK